LKLLDGGKKSKKKNSRGNQLKKIRACGGKTDLSKTQNLLKKKSKGRSEVKMISREGGSVISYRIHSLAAEKKGLWKGNT